MGNTHWDPLSQEMLSDLNTSLDQMNQWVPKEGGWTTEIARNLSLLTLFCVHGVNLTLPGPHDMVRGYIVHAHTLLLLP